MLAPLSMTDAEYQLWRGGIAYAEWLLSGFVDTPRLPWSVYTYGLDGFACKRPLRCIPNVMGYPFPQSTRVMSSLHPYSLHFLLCIP